MLSRRHGCVLVQVVGTPVSIVHKTTDPDTPCRGHAETEDLSTGGLMHTHTTPGLLTTSHSLQRPHLKAAACSLRWRLRLLQAWRKPIP